MSRRDFSVRDYRDSNTIGSFKEEWGDSSKNYDGLSGDDDLENDRRLTEKRRKYHRHSSYQIQELEAYFKEVPHPGEKQRLELSRRLSLDTNQVKFWFQNRRTQLKTQMGRHDNVVLKQENDKLRIENIAFKDGLRNPLCIGCRGSEAKGDRSYEENKLRIENAGLKDELDRVKSLAGQYMGRPSMFSVNHTTPPEANIHSKLAVNSNQAKKLSSMVDIPFDWPIILELATAAMGELIGKVQVVGSPLWTKSMDGKTSILNYDEYLKKFPPCLGTKPAHFLVDATKQTSAVNVDSEALVETFMDTDRWSDLFPCLVSKAITIEEISPGTDGTKDGALKLIHAELQVLSPLVAPRVVKFLRFSKQHGEGLWAVVDMSIDNVMSGHSVANARRLPSGCVLQDMPNGCSKVIWVEHSEYDPSEVPTMYIPVVSSGIAYGAERWLSTLQRQCESLSMLVLPYNPHVAVHTGLSQVISRTNVLKLAQRMVDGFCAGICVSPAGQWGKINSHGLGEDVKVMTRKSFNISGKLSGVIVSVSTSLWMPVPMEPLYDFLCDMNMRGEWDNLSPNAGQYQELLYISKSKFRDNGVSLLHAPAMETNRTSMLVLQEKWTDASGSLVVYAPLEALTMHKVFEGGDPSYAALLPSGFTIHPDGQPGGMLVNETDACSGSLLTVGFQVVIGNRPDAKLGINCLETVNHLLLCTVGKIKAAFGRITQYQRNSL